MNENTESSFNKLLIPGSVIIAGLLIAGAVMWNNSHPATVGAGGQQGSENADISKVKIDGEPYLGDPKAPVAIAFWSDFQCPYCKAFEVGHPQIPTPAAMPEIIKNYVDTGKVKIIFKDFAFLGPDSQTASLYGRAVWDLYPEQYFAWRTAMYGAQDEENGGFGDEASVIALTKTIAGIDAAKVTQATKDNKSAYEAAIAADRDEAQSFGVSATPSFIVGKSVIPGAQPYSSFQKAIDALL